MRAGGVLSLAGSLVMLVGAVQPAMLFPGRFLAGLSAGVAFGSGSVWLKELSAGAADGAAARRAATALSLGFGGGPLVTGVVAQWLPAPVVLPYLLHVVLIVAVTLLVWRVPETGNRALARPGSWVLVPEAARSGRFLLGVLPWAPWVFGTATVVAGRAELAGLMALFYGLIYLGIGVSFVLALVAGTGGYAAPVLIAALAVLLALPPAIIAARRPLPARGPSEEKACGVAACADKPISPR